MGKKRNDKVVGRGRYLAYCARLPMGKTRRVIVEAPRLSLHLGRASKAMATFNNMKYSTNHTFPSHESEALVAAPRASCTRSWAAVGVSLGLEIGSWNVNGQARQDRFDDTLLLEPLGARVEPRHACAVALTSAARCAVSALIRPSSLLVTAPRRQDCFCPPTPVPTPTALHL